MVCIIEIHMPSHSIYTRDMMVGKIAMSRENLH